MRDLPAAEAFTLMSQIWKTRRRAIVPAMHRRYIASMVAMFGDSMAHGAKVCALRPKSAACVRSGCYSAMLALYAYR